MVNLIEKYLAATPLYLEKSVSNYNQASKLNYGFDYLYLVGSGSSYNASRQVAGLMQKILQRPVYARYPFEIKQELFVDPQHTLVIGISQSGASVSTYQALALAKKRGCQLASLTGEKGSYLEQITSANFALGIPIEKAGPKTLGYTMTKLKLLEIAYQMRKMALPQSFVHLGENYSLMLKKVVNWTQVHGNEFVNSCDIRVVGPAWLYGDTLESALKLLETLRIHVTGYDYQEFIHGIYNSVNQNTFLIFLAPKECENFSELSKLLSRWTNHIYSVGSNDLAITDNSEVGKEFLYPIFAEYLAAKIPELEGYDPSIPKDKNFHSEMKSKIGKEF